MTFVPNLEIGDPFGRRFLLELLWHTGMRKGTIRALDKGDFHPRNQTLEVRHRPPETPLNDKDRGQRTIALSDEVSAVLADYVAVHRLDEIDENGREPLFTTRYGRLSMSAINNANVHGDATLYLRELSA